MTAYIMILSVQWTCLMNMHGFSVVQKCTLCLCNTPSILKYASSKNQTFAVWFLRAQYMEWSLVSAVHYCVFCMRTYANLTTQFAGWNVWVFWHNLPCWFSQDLLQCMLNCICVLGRTPIYGVWMLSLQNWAALLKQWSLWIVFLRKGPTMYQMSLKTTVSYQESTLWYAWECALWLVSLCQPSVS